MSKEFVLSKSTTAYLWDVKNLSLLSLKHFTREGRCSMFSTEHRQNSLQLTELKWPPRCTNPKRWFSKNWPRRPSKKSSLTKWIGARSLYQSEIEFSRYFKPLRNEGKSGKKSYRISNLLLTQKNVVNVVVENVVDPSENVVVVRKNVDQNVVVGSVKTQWTAVQAAHIIACEKPLSFVLAWLYNEARTYFQSQIWLQGGVWGGYPPHPFEPSASWTTSWISVQLADPRKASNPSRIPKPQTADYYCDNTIHWTTKYIYILYELLNYLFTSYCWIYLDTTVLTLITLIILSFLISEGNLRGRGLKGVLGVGRGEGTGIGEQKQHSKNRKD